ncbi:MAG: hypothetical protein N3A38_13130, partial [Planctomycetota bacterium]|nr:hypothetical protein [Planctomycetota bacterium]
MAGYGSGRGKEMGLRLAFLDISLRIPEDPEAGEVALAAVCFDDTVAAAAGCLEEATSAGDGAPVPDIEETIAAGIRGGASRRILQELGASEELAASPIPFPDAASRLMRLLRGASTIVEDSETASAALSRLFSAPPHGGAIGLGDIAAIADPACPSRDLPGILRHLGMTADLSTPPSRARAMRAAFRVLWKRILDIPLPALAEINYLLAPAGGPVADVMREAEAMATAARFAGEFAARRLAMEDLFEDFGELAEARRKAPDPEARDQECMALDAGRAVEAVGPEGPVARAMGEMYEERPQQVEMVSAVADALNRGAHLLAEAGTGVGKSLAYLVPAILWTKATGRPVIVSTHTKNLQSQLFDKDLPFLRECLGMEFRYALLKGRGNYLCVRRLLYVLGEAERELTIEERVRMAPVVAWAVRTETGDVAENFPILADSKGSLWSRVSTTGADCLGRTCRYFRKCFVNRARGLAHLADIVVINHSLLFAELGREKGTLPPAQEAVLDEAHNLEDAATEHLTCEVSASRVFRTIGRLFRERGRGRGRRRRAGDGEEEEPEGKGLLPSLLHALSAEGARDREAAAVCRRHAIEAMKAIPAVSGALERFLNAFAVLPGGEENWDRKRFSAGAMPPSGREEVEAAKEALVSILGAVRRPIEAAADALRPLRSSSLRRLHEYGRELAATEASLAELIGDVEFLAKASEPNHVYFVERRGEKGRPVFRVAAAPLEVGPLLYEQFFSRMRSFILTSATLRCGPGFDFIRDRLGLSLMEPSRVAELVVGAPFDYARQSRVLVPSFLPDPAEPEFNARLSDVLAGVFRAAGGRGLVLYTSYRAMEEGYEVLKSRLSGEGFHVLAQGVDGAREALLERLRAGGKTLVLGTSSFWEGIDVRGDALSVLVIAKLPFPVVTDPIHQGRGELLESRGMDPFMNLSVPIAILRLRQGFGRLIRSRTDRGVVIISDKRMLTRRYGGAFLRSLPTRHHTVTAPERLVEA